LVANVTKLAIFAVYFLSLLKIFHSQDWNGLCSVYEEKGMVCAPLDAERRGVDMDILGSIEGDNVPVVGREQIRGQMEKFVSRLRRRRRFESGEMMYKVQFWRPEAGAKIDSLIEFRNGGGEAWYARANGPDSMRAFKSALASLQQIVVELELREEALNDERREADGEES
jgi:hypothetical protein